MSHPGLGQIILFGDSITQACYSLAWGLPYLGAQLTDIYNRRLDVVLRGFGGYNTHQALRVLPRVVPEPEVARVRILVVFFGANDASLPVPSDCPQTVPLEEYKENLRAIAKHERVGAHEGLKLVLITPPPVDEHQLLPILNPETGGLEPSRTAAQTARYAEAVREVGKELEHTVVVDFWTTVIARVREAEDFPNDIMPGAINAPASKVLRDLLHDGLHLHSDAYRMLFDDLMRSIGGRWPEMLPHNLPDAFPDWMDGMAWQS